MPDFVFFYRNPVGYTPTPETTAAWTAWFEGMGQQLADLGKPAVARAALGNCGADQPGVTSPGQRLIVADLDV